MKKGKKDEYLDLLFAQHPEWAGMDSYKTLCLYMAFADFTYCEACMRADKCCAYRVFTIRSDYEELYQCMEQLRTRLAETKTGKSLDWDVLLERIGQEAKLEMDNYLSEKVGRQIKETREEKGSNQLTDLNG